MSKESKPERGQMSNLIRIQRLRSLIADTRKMIGECADALVNPRPPVIHLKAIIL